MAFALAEAEGARIVADKGDALGGVLRDGLGRLLGDVVGITYHRRRAEVARLDAHGCGFRFRFRALLFFSLPSDPSFHLTREVTVRLPDSHTRCVGSRRRRSWW